MNEMEDFDLEFPTEEIKLSDDSIEDLDLTCKKYKELCDQYDAEKAKLSDLNKEVEKYEYALIQKLEANEKKNWQVPGAKISISKRTTYPVPRSDEEKIEFFNFADSKGLKMKLMSVNSLSLNKFLKEQLEERENAGIFSVEFPGLSAPTEKKILSLKKA